jgi:hypothetical protein
VIPFGKQRIPIEHQANQSEKKDNEDSKVDKVTHTKRQTVAARPTTKTKAKAQRKTDRKRRGKNTKAKIAEFVRKEAKKRHEQEGLRSNAHNALLKQHDVHDASMRLS